jgi:hypothetical protein
MRFSSLALVALFALAEIVLAPMNCCAQKPGSEAWKQLQQNPKTWPAQVKLKTAAQLVITNNGQPVGAVTAPADSMVKVIAVEDSTLRIGVGSAQASIAPGQTDFADRLAAAAAASTSTNTASAKTPAMGNPAQATAHPARPLTPPSTAALPPVSGAPVQFDYNAPDGEGYHIADYHFWSPSYTQPLRGMIIMTPGANGDGRNLTSDPAWQALARKYGLGLVGSYLEGGHYQRPEAGTGQTLHDALHYFAEQSGHPEIATVPLLLWGMSAGGQWDYNYVLWKPAGVMAFVVNKGGFYNQDEADSATCAVPGLFILGETDEPFRVESITKLWTAGRSRGALWALTPQPNSGHEFSKTEPLARVFFEAVLKARLPDRNSLASESPDAPVMKPMQENPGWLGNVKTHDIHDDANDADIDRTAAWLPDESTAQAWKIFVSGG